MVESPRVTREVRAMHRRARALMSIGIVAIAMSLAAPVSAASPDHISFEADPSAIASAFTSVTNPTVHFHATSGGLLFYGNGFLTVGQNQVAALVISFDVPATRVSIAFRNQGSQTGPRATLKVFRAHQLVDTVHVPFDGDKDAVRTITYEGGPIDRAMFVYDVDGDRSFFGS